MNRVFRFSLAVLIVLTFAAGMASAQSSQESLGNYARAIKKAKNTPASPDQKKVYDNDNMPTTSSISVVGSAPAAPASDAAAPDQPKDANAPAAAGSDDKKDEKKDPEAKDGKSPSDRKEALDAWKKKLADQNDKVNGLAHELDLLQREYRVKSAEFYANTASRVQNPGGFSKDDADYKQKIADKQKELDDAKSKLSGMQDDARKAGAPTAVADRQQ